MDMDKPMDMDMDKPMDSRPSIPPGSPQGVYNNLKLDKYRIYMIIKRNGNLKRMRLPSRVPQGVFHNLKRL